MNTRMLGLVSSYGVIIDIVMIMYILPYMVKMDVTIQVRIDERTKRAAQRTLQEMGLDVSSAVKLFLKNVVITESIPFDVRTKNGFARFQEERMIAETEDAARGGKAYANYREMVRDL
ncbi:MAG: type II toxin-antitoxin system RelB/DinJ family antitoxin [Nanoarchaeota archaeon]|nr:type II toxin-antitoxin system RelB/DinJ family antitoxin [Nanoarchaeota archaeon]